MYEQSKLTKKKENVGEYYFNKFTTHQALTHSLFRTLWQSEKEKKREKEERICCTYETTWKVQKEIGVIMHGCRDNLVSLKQFIKKFESTRELVRAQAHFLDNFNHK